MRDYPSERVACDRLDALTKRLFGLPGDCPIGALEQSLIETPKARKGSARVGERIFLDAIRELDIANLLEIGGNDGRHTRRFLNETSATIHTFEPNVHALRFFAEIVGEPRLRYNPFGLSNQNSPAAFNILTELRGKEMEPVNGCSSFGQLTDSSAKYVTSVSMMCRGDDYLRNAKIDSDFALWVDVEGFAFQVLQGFGTALSAASFVICEVEMTDQLSTGSNVDKIIELLEKSGFEIVYRDFQNYGQCNLFCVNPAVSDRLRPIIDAHFEGIAPAVRKAVRSLAV